MANFAHINENNIVTEVIVIPNEYEIEGQNYINNVLGLPGTWLQTSYNNNIRYNFAGLGFSYDPVNDAFIAPKPYNSWILNANFDWESPVPYPGTPGDLTFYCWDESIVNWVVCP
jgi:hypothetical protein